MEPYIRISEINDFIFCPRSIYFHKLYGKYNKRIYQERPQIIGTINHNNIDQQKYSTEKKFLQGLDVFSEKYNLCGKIDIFNTKTGELIERKTKIKKIYDGYRYQLYAQCFCLQEMGYTVKKLKIHSLQDNKNYFFDVPNQREKQEFENILQEMRKYSLSKKIIPNKKKCQNCIYRHLCDSNIS